MEAASDAAESGSFKMLNIRFVTALISAESNLAMINLPELREADQLPAKPPEALVQKHFFFCALTIFLYVGGELSIGGFLVSFLSELDVTGLSEAKAANYVVLYWGGEMVRLLQGVVADAAGFRLPFVIPLLRYLYIALFGFRDAVPISLS